MNSINDVLNKNIEKNCIYYLPTSNGILNKFIYTYNIHKKIIIDPKNIWCTIISQVYKLIIYNSDKLKKKYINIDAPQNIIIMSHPLDKEIYDEFSNNIHKNILDKTFKDWVLTKFSTTMHSDSDIMNMMYMGIFKNFFKYTCISHSISQIEILGSLNDWCLIKKNLKKLNDFKEITHYDITGWIDRLNKFIDEFVLAKQNIVNIDFWNNFLHTEEDYIMGNCIVLGEFYEKKIHDVEDKVYLVQNLINNLYLCNIQEEKVFLDIDYFSI